MTFRFKIGPKGLLQYLQDRLSFKSFVIFVIPYYFIKYFQYLGNNKKIPFWWGWYDQGQYLLSSEALLHLDLSPQYFAYPPLYPAMGAIFLPFLGFHSYFPINLAILVFFMFVFYQIAIRYVSNLTALLILLVTVIFNKQVFDNFIIPWTSTASTAILSICLYFVYLYVENPDRELITSSPRRFVFLFGLVAGLMALARPLDTIISGSIFLIFLIHFLYHHNTGTRIFEKIKILLSSLGILIGPLLYLFFNMIIFGAPLSGYFKTGQNGYFFSKIPEDFFALFLDNSVYLEPSPTLFRLYPWFLVFVLGSLYIFRRCDLLCKTIIAAIFIHASFYLPYRDLLPLNIFRFHLIHYFKWIFPYSILITYLFISDMVADLSKNIIRFSFRLLILTIFFIFFASIHFKVSRTPINFMGGIPLQNGGATPLVLELAQGTKLVDLQGLNGLLDYTSSPQVFINDRLLSLTQDYHIVTASWGERIIFQGPVHGKMILFFRNDKKTKVPIRRVCEGTFILKIGTPMWIHPAVKIWEPYSIGSNINFSSSGNSEIYLDKGWSGGESWGRWTDGKSATLHLEIFPIPQTPVYLQIKMGALLTSNHKIQHVIILINHVVVKKIRFKFDLHNERPNRIIIPLKSEFFKNRGRLVLEIKTPDAISPKKIHLNGDSRQLGISMNSIKIINKFDLKNNL